MVSSSSPSIDPSNVVDALVRFLDALEARPFSSLVLLVLVGLAVLGVYGWRTAHRQVEPRKDPPEPPKLQIEVTQKPATRSARRKRTGTRSDSTPRVAR